MRRKPENIWPKNRKIKKETDKNAETKTKTPTQAGEPDRSRRGRAQSRSKSHGMYYLSHMTLDTDHGIVLDVAVTAGDASEKRRIWRRWSGLWICSRHKKSHPTQPAWDPDFASKDPDPTRTKH